MSGDLFRPSTYSQVQRVRRNWLPGPELASHSQSRIPEPANSIVVSKRSMPIIFLRLCVCASRCESRENRMNGQVSRMIRFVSVLCVSCFLASEVGSVHSGEKTGDTDGQSSPIHSSVSSRVIRDANVLLTQYAGGQSGQPNQVELSSEPRVEIVERGSSSRSTRG